MHTPKKHRRMQPLTRHGNLNQPHLKRSWIPGVRPKHQEPHVSRFSFPISHQNKNFPTFSQQANKERCSNTSNHINIYKFVNDTRNAGTFPPEEIDSISTDTESLESPISSLSLSQSLFPYILSSPLQYTERFFFLLYTTKSLHQFSPQHYLQKFSTRRIESSESKRVTDAAFSFIAHWQKPHERPVTNKL